MNQPIALGTVLEVVQYGGAAAKFVVDGYNEDDYMMMTNLRNKEQFMTIHPGHAARIAANGVDSGIKVLDGRSLNDIVVKATKQVVSTPKPAVVQAAPTAKTGSKKERALAIKAANPNATRKELIVMFMEQLDMTAAGASTYASMK